jgi:hypothetical protein
MAEDTVAESAPAVSDADPNAGLTEVCQLRMTAPDAHEWKTYWNPEGQPMISEGPSSARSSYWANAEERAALQDMRPLPLMINCRSGETAGLPAISVNLSAYNLPESEVPLAPGTYPLVATVPDMSAKPGGFTSGGLVYGDKRFDLTSGTLTITRFDMKGVAGSFKLQGKEMFTGGSLLAMEGTFDIPCLLGKTSSACESGKGQQQ